MTLTISDDGFLYLFGDGKSGRGNTELAILYPTPRTNNGDPVVSGNEEVQTEPITFNGPVADAVVWIVWSKEKIDDVEAARQSAFASAGLVGSSDATKLRDFLKKNFDAERPDFKVDEAKTEATVKISGDVLR